MMIYLQKTEKGPQRHLLMKARTFFMETVTETVRMGIQDPFRHVATLIGVCSLLTAGVAFAQNETRLDGQAAGDTAVFSGAVTLEEKGVIWKDPPYHFYYPLMDCAGYIKPAAVPAVGRIEDTQPLVQKSIKEGTKVYLDLFDDTTISVGDRYHLLRIVRIGENNTDHIISGKQHYITGIVEVTHLESKNPCCGAPASRAKGKVITAFREILVDDKLVPFDPQPAKITVVPSNEQLTGRVLFGENHEAPIKENAVVFIDKGRIHGMEVGQYYDIYNQPKGEKALASPEMEKREYKGSLLVIRLEDETSTALITYAYKPITPGDPFFPSKKVKL